MSSPTFFATLKKRLRAPRQLSLTRAGKFFLLITLAVGFGAINTGNNLLFLLFGMLLALILASGILSEGVIKNLRLRRRLPKRIFENEAAPGSFQLHNSGPWPSLSVVASEQNPLVRSGPLKGQTIGPSQIPWWKFWRQQTDQDSSFIAATYCLRADGNQATSLDTLYTLPARGRVDLPGLQITTRFPFGLFEKSRLFEAPATLLVYPRAEPADPWLGLLDSRFGDTSKNRRGQGEEFFGLRDYRPGEDQRSIHWKSTARRGEPIVRESEARERRALGIIFDTRQPISPTAHSHHRFEQGLRRLTGFLQALQARGYRIELSTINGHIKPANAGDIDPILATLAEIDLRPASAPSPLAQDSEPDASLARVYVAFQDHQPRGFDGLFLPLDKLDNASAHPHGDHP